MQKKIANISVLKRKLPKNKQCNMKQTFTKEQKHQNAVSDQHVDRFHYNL